MFGMARIRLAVGEPSKDKRYLVNVVWQHDDVVSLKSNNAAYCIDAASDYAMKAMEKNCNVDRGRYYWQWSVEINSKLIVHSLPEPW
jgi:hypothetical protein